MYHVSVSRHGQALLGWYVEAHTEGEASTKVIPKIPLDLEDAHTVYEEIKDETVKKGLWFEMDGFYYRHCVRLLHKDQVEKGQLVAIFFTEDEFGDLKLEAWIIDRKLEQTDLPQIYKDRGFPDPDFLVLEA